MDQTPVPDQQTCPSSGPDGDWLLVPFHCTGCGHVFPCTPFHRVSHCGICGGDMEIGGVDA